MRRIDRREAFALLGCTALTACAAPALVTRDRPRDPFEGGIGGTGIVGVLTDFGSLMVNGLRVELVGSSQVSSPFGPSSTDALAPGMAMTIFAARRRDRLVARRVAIDYALIGVARQGSAGEIFVNGVRVRSEPGARNSFEIDTRVAVFGAWTADGVVASRIDPAPGAQDLIAGTASLAGPTGLSISGKPVRIETALPKPGSYAVAIGRHFTDGLVAEQLIEGRLTGRGTLRQLSVEGYLEPALGDPGFRVAGLGHSFGPELQLGTLSSQRAIYFGPYDGLFQASAGYIVPEDFEARRRLLRPGLENGFDGQIIRTR